LSAHRELIAVGKIVKAFGIKGDVIVQPMTDDPERFRLLRNVRISRGPGETNRESHGAVRIERVAIGQRGVRLKLEGVDDRSRAEDLVGRNVLVDEEQRVRLPKGRYFIHDIIGLAVVDEQGRHIGVVKDIMRLPANDVYVVDRHGRELLLPAVKEFIKQVDLDSRSVCVSLIEGMLEE
jgi:16S rRNA processing protein RimM